MQEHITLTLADIDQRITGLQSLRSQLLAAFNGGGASLPASPIRPISPISPIPPAAVPKRKYLRAAARVPQSSTPVNSATRATLEKRLQDALKQRDHARETGHDQMADIFQRDIDSLEKQLASLK